MGKSSAAAHSLRLASYNERVEGSRPSSATAANKNTVALIPPPQ